MSYFSFLKNIFYFKRKVNFSIEEQLAECLDKRQKESIEKINKLFNENDSFALFVHKNADPDAICSAIALAIVLKSKGKKARVVALEKINNQSKKIISYYPYPISYEYDFTERSNDVYVLLDAPDFTCIKAGIIVVPEGKKVIIIDHHIENEKCSSAVRLISPEATSTAILLYFLFKQTNCAITKEIAVFLLMGIVADTGFLKQANNMDFIALFELSQYESISNIRSVLNKEKDENERIETLKAMLRLKVYQFGNLLVGYTYAGSYGASIALTHIYSGCDIVFVETRGKNSLSVSARSRKHLENKINLASVLSGIAGKYRKYNGTGGGHKSAASMQMDISNSIYLNMENQIIVLLEKILNKKSKIIKI
ncbi:MAG: hypothetical protein DRN66_03925 [Candidatus Nanohalarchaeota archaeon]|nr:MAG: hypothetical protein DRN66_03925 [Candidatus Nanohaloarchaeota archaeon]